jgi:hypothetical protein
MKLFERIAYWCAVLYFRTQGVRYMDGAAFANSKAREERRRRI